MSVTQLGQGPEKSTHRWWALAALALSGLTIGLDATVLNIALPELSTSLHATTGQLQWFSTAYTLVVGVAMLPASNLGDRYGRKRLLITSLVLFAATSAWCAWSASPGELIAARAVLGLAGAALMPLGLAMLPTLFPKAEDRSRAVMIWTAAGTLGLPLGPIVGGWLLNHFWWGAVFVLNVPLALAGALALLLLLPEARSARPVRLDLPGALLSSAGLGAVIYGFINAGQHGWGSLFTWGAMLAGLALLAGFVAWERHTSHPLIELSLFGNGQFSWGTVHATMANFALFGVLFAVPQFFQSVSGTSPLGTGVRLLPMIGGIVVGSQAGARLIRRSGSRLVITAGFALDAIALGAAATTKVGTGYGFAAAWIAVLGLGIGMVLSAAMTDALGALSAERAGAGSGLLQALRQVGGTMGVAILGTVLSAGYRDRLYPGQLSPALNRAAHDSVASGIQVATTLHDRALAQAVKVAFVHGMDLALIVAGALVLAIAVLTVVFLPGSKHRAQQAAGPAADVQPDAEQSVG